jgi:biotin operon repressor
MNDPDHLRITSRISMDYVVSIYSAILRGSRHDPIDALILSTVAVANVAHLNADRDLSLAYGGIDTPEPQAIKRPISRNAVALSLGLSYETARRRIQKLIDAGALLDLDGGLIGANEQANPEMVKAMAEQNATLLRRLVRQLRDHGIEV